MYRLDNKFTRGRWSVTIAGCGGTGGFVAEGLCRLLPDKANIILVDHDRVEERNLGRQNFTGGELGMFKSEALAVRLSSRYGRPVAYSTLPIAMVDASLPGLIIGCLDNGPARRAIAGIRGMIGSPYQCTSWWIDAGNGENYGQVLIGNYHEAAFDPDICLALPLPTIQSPELLAQAPQRRSCAEMDEQGPTINQAVASLVVEAARRLIEGTCHWMQLYLDLETGTLYPVMATPETAKRITKVTM
ncbi:unnamed protein product, partial [marine sediment metagenome]